MCLLLRSCISKTFEMSIGQCRWKVGAGAFRLEGGECRKSLVYVLVRRYNTLKVDGWWVGGGGKDEVRGLESWLMGKAELVAFSRGIRMYCTFLILIWD